MSRYIVLTVGILLAWVYLAHAGDAVFRQGEMWIGSTTSDSNATNATLDLAQIVTAHQVAVLVNTAYEANGTTVNATLQNSPNYGEIRFYVDPGTGEYFLVHSYNNSTCYGPSEVDIADLGNATIIRLEGAFTRLVAEPYETLEGNRTFTIYYRGWR